MADWISGMERPAPGCSRESQEKKLEKPVPMPPAGFARAPAPMAADPGVLGQIVDRLLAAERPWIMTEFIGRHPGNFDKLVELELRELGVEPPPGRA